MCANSLTNTLLIIHLLLVLQRSFWVWVFPLSKSGFWHFFQFFFVKILYINQNSNKFCCAHPSPSQTLDFQWDLDLSSVWTIPNIDYVLLKSFPWWLGFVHWVVIVLDLFLLQLQRGFMPKKIHPWFTLRVGCCHHHSSPWLWSFLGDRPCFCSKYNKVLPWSHKTIPHFATCFGVIWVSLGV